MSVLFRCDVEHSLWENFWSADSVETSVAERIALWQRRFRSEGELRVAAGGLHRNLPSVSTSVAGLFSVAPHRNVRRRPAITQLHSRTFCGTNSISYSRFNFQQSPCVPPATLYSLLVAHFPCRNTYGPFSSFIPSLWWRTGCRNCRANVTQFLFRAPSPSKYFMIISRRIWSKLWAPYLYLASI